jgi:hypothetical protein
VHQHSIFPRDDGVVLRKNRLDGQSEDEFSDWKDVSAGKKPAKRKQSLRVLFGFLDKHEEATDSECQVAMPVQRNELDPLPTICNATGLLDAKQSPEGTINCGQVPVDCNGFSSVEDTQVSSPTNQEVEYSKLPVTCFGADVTDNRKCFQNDGIDSIKHGKMLVDLEGISSVETQDSSPADQEHEYCKLPANCVSSSLADIQKCSSEDSPDSIENGNLPLDPDGISSVDTQDIEVSSPADQEVEHGKLPGTTVVSGLAVIQKGDGIDNFERPINFFGVNLTDSEKGPRDGSEHKILPVCPRSIILADNKENSPVKEIGTIKPAMDSKGPEQTVASDGFVAIKRKHRLPEGCETDKIPKYPVRRDKASVQENHNVLGQKDMAQVHTRSLLADRTNFREAAAAPTAGFSGKWKCPSKGKPHVGPPMKQLRLDQWLR